MWKSYNDLTKGLRECEVYSDKLTLSCRKLVRTSSSSICLFIKYVLGFFPMCTDLLSVLKLIFFIYIKVLLVLILERKFRKK